MKINEESLRDLRDNAKCTSMHSHYRGPRGESKREKETDKIFEKIITGNFANMRKETVIQVQEIQSPYR